MAAQNARIAGARLGITLGVILLWFGFACSAEAALVKLDFEDLGPGTVVTNQYGDRGIVFSNHVIGQSPTAHSGTHVLLSAKPSDEIFQGIPIAISFNAPQRRVHLFAASSGVPLPGTLTAFDANGNVIATDGPKTVPVDVYTTPFQVQDSAATPRIVRVELRLDDAAHFGIDDLEIEGDPAPPPPPAPRVVFISPIDGAEIDATTMAITGTVTGDGLLSSVTLTMLFARPPESTAPPFQSSLPLNGAGQARTFAIPDFSIVPLGPISLTVRAENIGGAAGVGSVKINNLPTAIRSRLATEGGPAAFGGFSFGLYASGCRIAVFTQGLVSNDDNTQTTRVARGPILAKWLSLRSAFETNGIGCPLGEERSGPGNTRVQDFQGGRIYVGGPVAAAFVPRVFADAIDLRGGEAATGIPLSDPTNSSGAMQTWLFQRFMRPERPELIPSTLEIRGTPPRLWLERQSWDLSVDTTATIWEDFSCSGLQGPCDVTAPPPEPPPIPNAGLFCDDTTYPFGPAEWRAILSNYISTPVFGVATSSSFAEVDNPLTHEYIYDHNCPLQVDCPSDWTVHIKPIGPQRGIAPFSSILASNTRLELEYENYIAQYAHVLMDWPEVGDLFQATGRWIIDCGHDTYHSELHPIFSFAKMKTVTFQGRPTTRADIWVNGWWPGDAIEVNIFPPPRPSPDSILSLNKPVDADAAFNVNLTFSFEPAAASNHAHVIFTAARREVEVTSAGEMLFQSGRGYEGQWFIAWSP
jgi:hypothetical protein